MVVKVHGGVITDQTLTGNLRYFQIAKTGIGANAIGDGNHRAAYASVADGGPATGAYVAGDVLTLGGTTAGTAATFTVLTVDSGAVTSVALTTDGDMSTIDTNPVATTGGSGTGATLNVQYTSNIIIPDATESTAFVGEHYVPYDDPVTGSAADLALSVVARRANIVQIAIITDDIIQFAVENTGYSWVTIDGSGPSSPGADDDMLDAIAALGAAVTVPDETNTGTTINFTTGVTITEKFFSSGIA
jgi:hypothetical protein